MDAEAPGALQQVREIRSWATTHRYFGVQTKTAVAGNHFGGKRYYPSGGTLTGSEQGEREGHYRATPCRWPSTARARRPVLTWHSRTWHAQ